MGNKLQRFFWTISGAEIDILEKCKTDYQKYTVIGVTIFMTAFIAFLAGTSAAWYFTQSGTDSSGNIFWSIAFGFVWSMLILSIDRSLVVTLKKDPSLPLTKQHFMLPLFSRVLLGALIALMVSIPVELFIFEDYIAQQKIIYNEESAIDFAGGTYAGVRKAGTDKKIENVTKRKEGKEKENQNIKTEISSLENKIQRERNKLDHPVSNAYKTAKNKRNKCDNQIYGYQRKLSQANNRNDSIRYRNQIASLRRERNQYSSTMSREVSIWNSSIRDKIYILEKDKASKEDVSAKNNEYIGQLSGKIDQYTEASDSLGDEMGKHTDVYVQALNNGNHFVENVRVLEYAVSKPDKNGNTSKECIFLYAIRLLFFIIEILPTIVKIVTPVGTYDRMIEAEEKNMASYLASSNYMNRICSMHDIELQAKENQLNQQRDIELQLKNEILQKVKETQIEVANAAIAKWKENEMAKINTVDNEKVLTNNVNDYGKEL